MITGHCSAGWHPKCTVPGRCSCTCHGTRTRDLSRIVAAARPAGEWRCPSCPADFHELADRDHHVATIHTRETPMPPPTPGHAPGEFDCPHCRQECGSRRGLGQHFRHNPTHRPGIREPGQMRTPAAAPDPPPIVDPSVGAAHRPRQCPHRARARRPRRPARRRARRLPRAL